MLDAYQCELSYAIPFAIAYKINFPATGNKQHLCKFKKKIITLQKISCKLSAGVCIFACVWRRRYWDVGIVLVFSHVPLQSKSKGENMI